MSDDDRKARRILATPRPTLHPEKLDANKLDGVRLLKPVEASGPPTECIVCNGKTVHAPAADGSKRIVGFDTDKKENVFALVTNIFQPGQTVSLPLSEFERLRDLGFVCAPADYEPLPPRKTVDEAEVHRFGPELQ